MKAIYIHVPDKIYKRLKVKSIREKRFMRDIIIRLIVENMKKTSTEREKHGNKLG